MLGDRPDILGCVRRSWRVVDLASAGPPKLTTYSEQRVPVPYTRTPSEREVGLVGVGHNFEFYLIGGKFATDS